MKYDPNIRLVLVGLVYRADARDGGVLTGSDEDMKRVAEHVEATVGEPIEKHEAGRIDGTHIVEVLLEPA